MTKPSFSTVWNRITAHGGGTFTAKTGHPLTYAVDGDGLVTSRTDYRLTYANFEAAYERVPFEGPGDISSTIRGPAYVWAILHDARIRAGDW